MSERRTLAENAIRALTEAHPGLPAEYLDYLREVGWGIAGNGHMIYAGPVKPRDLYKGKFDREGILLLGYDYRGYSFGYDAIHHQYGAIGASGGWEPWPADEGFAWCVTEVSEEPPGCRYTRDELAAVGEDVPNRGPICLCCKEHIPQFAELTGEDEDRLRSLARDHNVPAVFRELTTITGCPTGWAKRWYMHRGRPTRPTPCPFCGRPLRSARAKQCRFCKKEWHDPRDVKSL